MWADGVNPPGGYQRSDSANSAPIEIHGLTIVTPHGRAYCAWALFIRLAPPILLFLLDSFSIGSALFGATRAVESWDWEPLRFST
jgi:hypothetical protein